MSEPENFLTRWSRRKLVTEEPVAPAADEAAPPKLPEDQDKETIDAATAGAPQTPPAPAFDPASLPSLDSIGAETDITAFLKAGVPGDLRLAALRRAWVTDPAIRDFKGLAENDWDFTVPNEAMGFGEIDPGLDIKKMLADVFGDKPQAEVPEAELPPEAEQPVPARPELSAPANQVALNSIDDSSRDKKTAGEDEIVQRNNNIASQPDDDARDVEPVKQKRRQGGALPQQ